jgi:hypothetical protein
MMQELQDGRIVMNHFDLFDFLKHNTTLTSLELINLNAMLVPNTVTDSSELSTSLRSLVLDYVSYLSHNQLIELFKMDLLRLSLDNINWNRSLLLCPDLIRGPTVSMIATTTIPHITIRVHPNLVDLNRQHNLDLMKAGFQNKHIQSLLFDIDFYVDVKIEPHITIPPFIPPVTTTQQQTVIDTITRNRKKQRMLSLCYLVIDYVYECLRPKN